MTRRVVYGVGVWLTLAATALTLASITIPQWVSWDDMNDKLQYSYGLHSKCSSLSHTCKHFPSKADCLGKNRTFCSLWRSVGFFMNFTVILECATLIAFAVVILGGKQKRDQGWKIVTTLLMLGVLVQCASMAIVAHLYNTDDRFTQLGPNWHLDKSWILCTTSWLVMLLSAIGLILAARYLPEEGDYELIPNRAE